MPCKCICGLWSRFRSYIFSEAHGGKMKRVLRLASILLFVLVLMRLIVPGPATAQVSNGSISGNIADPQGSGVPQATVTATNKATNQELTTTSDNSGLFRLGLVPPGTYRIEISKQAFR